jgi:hypothetical protein
MQAPGKLDLECYAGATFNYDLTYLAAGSPVDLSGYDARLQVRKSYENADAVFSLSVGSGITLGGTAGSIELFIDAADSAGLNVRRVETWLYDLELEDEAGKVTRLVEGQFRVLPEVTR